MIAYLRPGPARVELPAGQAEPPTARLRRLAQAAQAEMLAALREWERQGQVHALQPLWIVNAIAFQAPPALVRTIAAWPAVDYVGPDRTWQWTPEPGPETALAVAPVALTATTNISITNAPLLWEQSITGTGVVVASLDTGVDATHPDLAPRRRGGAGSWYDPYGQCAEPCDFSPISHGTRVLGLLVGGEASGQAIGMAPGARWIAARAFNNNNSAEISKIHLAFQWLLDPDSNPATPDVPQIVNASWDFLNPGGCDLEFAPDLRALVAAGIVPVFAAGNAGPQANTALSPANNPDALPVGNVDNAGVAAVSSSRGPTACGTGQSRTFPDLSAPGVGVFTTDRMVAGNPAPRYANATGTSFSAPHVSGALALLLSAFPGRTFSVAELRVALTYTAKPLGAAPNNDTGAGLVDVWAAYQALLAGTAPAATPTWTPSPAPPTATLPPTATATPNPTSTPAAVGMPVFGQRLFFPVIQLAGGDSVTFRDR